MEIISNKKIIYKITPNQVHKILERLKEIVKNLKREEWEEVTVTEFILNKVDISLDNKKIKQKFQNIFTQRIKDKKLLAQIQEDILNIKESLFAFNVNSKVSEKLSQIETLKGHIRYYQIFKECLECEENFEELVNRAKEYLKNNEEATNVKIDFAFYDYNEIKKILRELNKKIMELEKEITYLNASNEIEIKIYKETAELIGLG